MDNLTAEAYQAAIETAYWTRQLVCWTAGLTVATFFLGVAAVAGNWLAQVTWYKTRLRISLAPDNGEKYSDRGFEIRYYRLRVTNGGSRPATEAHVQLLKVEAVGLGEVLWDSEVPLKWLHSPHYTPPRITLGRPRALCDLFTVDQLGVIRLQTAFTINNLDLSSLRAPGTPLHLVLTVEVRSLEAVSRRHRFELEWNGKWEAHKADMDQALKLRQLD